MTIVLVTKEQLSLVRIRCRSWLTNFRVNSIASFVHLKHWSACVLEHVSFNTGLELMPYGHFLKNDCDLWIFFSKTHFLFEAYFLRENAVQMARDTLHGDGAISKTVK